MRQRAVLLMFLQEHTAVQMTRLEQMLQNLQTQKVYRFILKTLSFPVNAEIRSILAKNWTLTVSVLKQYTAMEQAKILTGKIWRSKVLTIQSKASRLWPWIMMEQQLPRLLKFWQLRTVTRFMYLSHSLVIPNMELIQRNAIHWMARTWLHG